MRDSQCRSQESGECLNGECGGHDVRGLARPAGGRAAARCAPERVRLERVAGPAAAARNYEQLLRFCTHTHTHTRQLFITSYSYGYSYHHMDQQQKQVMEGNINSFRLRVFRQ